MSMRTNFQIGLRGRSYDLSQEYRVLGIVNVTPDSFSDGGKFLRVRDAIRHARKLIDDGADILDIGGESTRPGSKPVEASEELQRVLPVIESIRAHSDIPISIDTQKALVAEEAINAGADMVNDVSALQSDPLMAVIIAKRNVPVVLMHMKGTPETMQNKPEYTDVVEEVGSFFRERIAFCRAHGILQVILDPGIGFGKSVEDNLALLRGLRMFRDLGRPVMVGTSRKSFLGSLTGTPVDERLSATLASNIVAYQNGASVLRVHDVREMKSALHIVDVLRQKSQGDAHAF